MTRLGNDSPGEIVLQGDLTIGSVVELSVLLPHRTEYWHVTCLNIFMVPV